MKKGFTLVELILYLSIAALILLAVAAFLSLLLEARVKSQAINEVEAQGAAVMQRMTQVVRNAQYINLPATSTSATMLSLAVSNGTNNPTIFGVTGGVFGMKEGTAATTTLTNARVTVSNVSFQNLSAASSTGTIRMQFALSLNNSAGRYEFIYAKTFVGSATVRR